LLQLTVTIYDFLQNDKVSSRFVGSDVCLALVSARASQLLWHIASGANGNACLF
jgi:hypothetical protein